MTKEAYSGKKFVAGVLSPHTFITKTLGLALNAVIYVTIISALCWGVMTVFDKFFKDEVRVPDSTTVAEGGTANIDKSNTRVTHNHFPLSDIFSFGSKNKIKSD